MVSTLIYFPHVLTRQFIRITYRKTSWFVSVLCFMIDKLNHACLILITN